MQYGVWSVAFGIEALIVVYLALRRWRKRRANGVFRGELNTSVSEAETSEGSPVDGGAIREDGGFERRG